MATPLSPACRLLRLARRTVAVAFALGLTCASAQPATLERALAQESDLLGHPERAAAALAAQRADADAAGGIARDVVYALGGQALVHAGNPTAAEAWAEALERTADGRASTRAAALVVRSVREIQSGDASRAMEHAALATDLLGPGGDPNLRYWSSLAHGQAARMRGHTDEALASLQSALGLAEASGRPLRRSTVLYQLSVLQWDLRNAQAALDLALAAFGEADAARNGYAKVDARMAEAAAAQLLERPARELAAMQDALALARADGSRPAIARALVNLADLRLRRRQYAEALVLSRDALAASETAGDAGLPATARANIGFALIGLGRVAEGRRYVDEALAVYERAGGSLETAELAAEYGRALEQAGDPRGALALYHRERSLLAEIAQQARARALAEAQAKYDAEKRRREIDLLARENAIKTAELEQQRLHQRVGWSVAALLAVSFLVVVALYRKLRQSSALLARTNAELDALSSRDPLTSLYNRRHFQRVIAAASAEGGAGRRGEDALPLAVLLVDLDHFKEINDRHGHARGDAVLVAVAGRLRDALRERDVIVRWGGEEFLVLARSAPDAVDDIVARVLRGLAAEPVVVDGQPIKLSASAGYLTLPMQPMTEPLPWDRALGLADMALYLAKSRGRNRACGIARLADDSPDTLAATERDLEHAWRSGRVEVREVFGPAPGAAGLSAVSSPRRPPPRARASG